jgi:ATP-dependent DNA helicase DinG
VRVDLLFLLAKCLPRSVPAHWAGRDCLQETPAFFIASIIFHGQHAIKPHREMYSIMKTIVALDLETTGLLPERDGILEVGMVRFNGDHEEARWTQLINPGCRIPAMISQLTGITEAMVAESPPIRDVLPAIRDFVGDHAVLGHNIRFDLSFLRKQKVLLHNEALDTLELASALLPAAPRYNLSSLCNHLGVPQLATHRALDDALATRAVYLALYEVAGGLSMELLAELVRHSQNVEWGGGELLEDALRLRLKKEGTLTHTPRVRLPVLEREGEAADKVRLEPRPEMEPLDPEETAALLGEAGPVACSFPHYEHRSQQMAMAAAVAKAFSESTHLLVEAGTGTGKSLAYLLPAMQWSIGNQVRVVISTNTINLQDQLIQKDIPDLCRALGLDVRAAVLKGRSNYICPRRLEFLRKREPETPEEMRVLAKILIWLTGSTTGDRAEINLNGPAERLVWSRLSAEEDQCSRETCHLYGKAACPFMRARNEAEVAHILVINHALLMADVASENKVLPEFQYLVIDEGHHLESAATDGLSFAWSQPEMERSIQELGARHSGLLGGIFNQARKAGPAIATDFADRVDSLLATAEDALKSGRRFYQSLRAFITEQVEHWGEYTLQYRLVAASRSQPGWEDVEEAWEEARSVLTDLARQAAALAERLEDAFPGQAREEDEQAPAIAGWARRLAGTLEAVQRMVAKPDAQTIYWVEMQKERDTCTLRAAPLQVGPLMEKFLWHQKSSIVLTSATLTTAGEFDYLRGRLNADETETLAVGSPFDYENSALLYLVDDIPEPADARSYQTALQKGLIDLCRATQGRTLVLFTSYSHLRQTSQAISGPLAQDDIIVYEQGEGASPHALLETFRTAEHAVLLGTRSFWEGVDVPGEALSVLVIVRLPFDVPSDPIVAARSELYENPFNQYSLPEAILRFRQGFGRLIRTKSDRGIVVLLDRRILTKSYGRAFLDSLPDCTRERGSLAGLAARAAKWLDA